MQLMVALKPIHDAAGHRAADRLHLPVRVGHRASRRWRSSRRRRAPRSPASRCPAPAVYPHPIAFNVLGGAGNFTDGDDYTDEERKMMFETRKILGDERHRDRRHLRPRARAHLALGVGDAADARAAVGRGGARAAARRARARGRRRPGHATATRRRSPPPGRDEVFVGRIRRDPSHPRGAEPVGRQRQPAQGRGHERRPARRGAARARARRPRDPDPAPGEGPARAATPREASTWTDWGTKQPGRAGRARPASFGG